MVISCLIVQFNYQLLTDKMNTVMNAVFKQYNVCDDVAEIICQKVHKGHQEVINNHISVIVGWNEDFDYWRFHNVRVPSKQILDIEKKILNPQNKYTLSVIMDFIKKHHKYNKNVAKKLMSDEDYMRYVWSNKSVFSIGSIPRFSSFLKFCRQKCCEYTSLRNPDTECRKEAIKFLSLPMRKMPELIRSAGIIHRIILSKGRVSNVFKIHANSHVSDPITVKLLLNTRPYQSYHNHKITKKELIQFLNQNGDSRKLTNKSKPELWKMAIKV